MTGFNDSTRGPRFRQFRASATMATNASDTATNYNFTTPTVLQFSAVKTAANTDDITVDLANNRFIINTTARYLVDFSLPHFSIGFRATIEGSVYVNGVILSSRSFSYIRGAAVECERDDIGSTIIVDLNAGDLVDLRVRRSEGSLTDEPVTALENATFEILRVD